MLESLWEYVKQRPDVLAHFDELNVVLMKLKDGSSESPFPKLGYPIGLDEAIKRDYEHVVGARSRLVAEHTQYR